MSDSSGGWERPALFSESEDEDQPGTKPLVAPVAAVVLEPVTLVFGAHSIVLEQPAGGAALGERIWRGALILARALLAEPELCDKRRVLELGCGVGLCGILASLLGASSVTLTDCSWESLKSLLPNTRRIVELAEDGVPSPASWGAAEQSLQIRWHLWETDVPRSPGRPLPQHWANICSCTWGCEGPPPKLEDGLVYDAVVGADVLYFHQQVDPLVYSILARLAPGGVALITVTVRKWDVYWAFLASARRCGLTIVSEEAHRKVDPLDEHHLDHDPTDAHPEGRDTGGAVHETANAVGEIMLVRLVRS